MGDSTKSHILTKSSDWNHWLFLGTTKPEKPIIQGTVTADKKLTYNYEMSNYRADYALYEKQQKALANLATYIQDSIATNLLPYITKLAPTNEATDLELEQQYNQLKRGPSNQNIEKWLQSWEEVYTKAKQRDLP
ncbi:hypothetical protein GTA08_BOTSDO13646 [Botryosphaeria dothidea]|uniref:Uncharacterized protein n=1 Tax=Botryosphaeria dothidea TaxID=55169 RepID=A0A8H4J0G7_9PEZI|nr:hypothetical protein GTA08_BOTSDO13646 [Botryosphaeria dothidea]